MTSTIITPLTNGVFKEGSDMFAHIPSSDALLDAVNAIAADIDKHTECGTVRVLATRHSDEHLDNKADWFGITGEQSAKEYLADRLKGKGDNKSARSIAQMVRQVTGELDLPPVESMRISHQWRDQGTQLSMPRLYSGQVGSAWRRKRKRSYTLPPVVRILCPLGCPAEWSADRMRKRGVAAAILSEFLNRAGYRTEIIGIDGMNTSSGVSGFFTVTIKPADKPTDLTRLADTIASPIFCRSVTYISGAKLYEEQGETVPYGLGKAKDPSKAQLAFVERANGAADLTTLVPTKTDSNARIKAWIKQTLADLQEGQRHAA